MKKKEKQEELSLDLEMAKEAEEKQELLRAAFLYKSALEKACELQDSQKIQELKHKVKELNKKSSDEYQTAEFRTEISKEEVEREVNHFLSEPSLEAILTKLTKVRFFPKFSEIEKSAQETMPISYRFVTVNTTDEDGNLVRGGEDGEYTWLMQMYGLSIGVHLKLRLLNILRELMRTTDQKKNLNEKSLMKYLQQSNILEAPNLPLVKIGIKRYFEEDYISAIHILIPQFENVFLRFSEKAGIDVLRLNQEGGISTQLKTLNSHLLKRKELMKVWSEDFCRFLDYVLFNPLGYDLRNKVAHGEIRESDCNFATVTVILFIFIFLAGRT